MNLLDTDILIVTDVQYDFLPGGALAVPDGDAVIPVINALGRAFPHSALTQDWHPQGHVSFASTHPGGQPFETLQVRYGMQVLWPDHCIQGSRGAALSEALDLPRAELIIRKGFDPMIDSYSAFIEADRTTTTGLQGYLAARGFRRVFVCGLATDYCVGWTALDARNAGFETFLIEDASRAIDLNGSLEAARRDWRDAGVHRIAAADLT